MKIAIIGCGLMAATHIRILKRVIPNAHIFLCDLDQKKVKALAQKTSVQGIYTDLEDLLVSEKPDIAHILTPPTSHAILAKKAILAGCHVLIEKPATETAGEFIEISSLANKHNKNLSVNYSVLGMPVIIKAKNIITSGMLGRLISVHCNYTDSWPGNTIPYDDSNHWAYSLKGGILQNWADHPASLLLDVMDPIHEHKILFLRRNVLPFNSPDLLNVMVRNEDQIGSFTLSLGHGGTDIRAHFFLEGGSIMVDMRRMLISFTRGKGPQDFIKRALSGIFEGYSLIYGTAKNSIQIVTGKLMREPGSFNVIENFYKTIISGEKRLISHQTAIAVTKLLENVWEEINHN